MVKVSKYTHSKELIIAKDFNFKAECSGHGIEIGYKEYIPSYQPMFSVSQDRLPQLIAILTAMQEALTQAKDDK